MNIINDQLVPSNKVLLPPLHIKLELMKQFVKSLDNESSALQYLQAKFPKLTSEKVRAGIFGGPQI